MSEAEQFLKLLSNPVDSGFVVKYEVDFNLFTNVRTIALPGFSVEDAGEISVLNRGRGEILLVITQQTDVASAKICDWPRPSLN